MQIDFHYYCIAVLARAAGFSARDALTLAYASQYVDDATEGEPMNINGMPFEPARTAHRLLERPDWRVQKRIFLPFHFVPAKRPTDDSWSFLTEPNSRLARAILAHADAQTDSPTTWLCALGIALHTYADTWAHQGFSGRDHQENDVEAIEYHDQNGWQRPLLSNIKVDILPPIGHAQADYFPDRPAYLWRYTNAGATTVTRNNTTEFLKAARHIYTWLATCLRRRSSSTKRRIIPWMEISPKLRRLMSFPSDNVEERCAAWQAEFSALFAPQSYHYDRLAWRKEALNPGHLRMIDWDDNPRAILPTMRYHASKNFYATPWVCFHRAAHRQRHFVLDALFYEPA